MTARDLPIVLLSLGSIAVAVVETGSLWVWPAMALAGVVALAQGTT